MLWIMLPGVAGSSSIHAIRVTHEGVVSIYGHVIVAPSAPPAPASMTPCGAHCHSDTERNRHARGIVPWRRIVDRRIRVNGGP
jgi:hypothetical protein